MMAQRMRSAGLPWPRTWSLATLESLLTHPGFSSEVYEELSDLLHQTYRLTGVIDDLLLLARMDAGHLRLASEPVNLRQIIDEWLDDLSAIPDSADLQTEKKLIVNRTMKICSSASIVASRMLAAVHFQLGTFFCVVLNYKLFVS